MPQLRKYSVKYPEKKNTKQRQQTNRKTELKVKKQQQQQQQQKTITKTTNNTLAHNYKQVIHSSIFYTEETIWLLLI